MAGDRWLAVCGCEETSRKISILRFKGKSSGARLNAAGASRPVGKGDCPATALSVSPPGDSFAGCCVGFLGTLSVSFQLNLIADCVSTASPVAPQFVAPDMTLREVFALLKENGDSSILVGRDGRLEGIFTERDALQLMADGTDLDEPVESAMTATVVTLPDDAMVGEAIRLMSEGGYRRLPMIDNEGRAVGIVKVSGIVHYLVEHVPEAVYNLPPDPRPMTQQREGA